ncbi:hypothetical protein [Dokdonella soli]|uniref:hypothetical protein n=1 Tax=Dokdonella soli TaxID=529810 RepID=UPI00360ECA6C
MNSFRVALVAIIVAAVMGSVTPAYASQDVPQTAQAAPNLTGLHDFDFLVGEWHGHHRKLKERLANSHEWVEFEGTLSMRKLMDGWANVDDNVFNVPGGTYRGVGLRSYDPKTGQWAIWWLDGRNPFGELDPPVKGHFENGVGTFYANDTLRGKPVRVRFIWSQITPTSARWEQAYSPDAGKTWETNWIMEFKRVP